MKRGAYEDLVKNLISTADTLDHTKDPCSEDFIPSIAVCSYISSLNIAIS